MYGWHRKDDEDRGSGIDREALANIFKPFYMTKSGGTGLGRAIAKKIDEHGGKIIINSEHGMDTEAVVELPRKEEGV